MKDFLSSHIQLENARVCLIPFTAEKAEGLKSIVFNDTVWAYMGMFIRNENEFQQYIADTLSVQGKTAYSFLILDKQTNEIAGSTRYGNINLLSRKLEIGWTWYGEKFQGTGLNKACKYELLNYGFEHIGLRRIQFSADEENIKSQKAIEKLGAVKEGLFRNNYIDSTGKSKNDIYYSIIAEEWSDLKKRIFQEFL